MCPVQPGSCAALPCPAPWSTPTPPWWPLADAGATLAEVVRTTIHVASTDRGDLGAAWAVVREAFAPHDPPSTLLGVAVLGYPDQLVEVDAVATLLG